MAAAVSRIATNINHVCRRINSTGRFYDADVSELKDRMADVWELLKV
ncbi:plasmid mobilization relaxosome protein MobC [Blautia wexlerae]